MKDEMTAEQRARYARQFLRDAEREFANGDIRQASEKLWGAATDAVTAIALRRDWRHRSHRDLKNAVQRLAAEPGKDHLIEQFITAEKFHINFYNDLYEGQEFEADRSETRTFVAEILALMQD